MRFPLVIALVLASIAASAKDYNPETCRALFSKDDSLAKQCLARVEVAKSQALQTLSDKQLSIFCSGFDAPKTAIQCFTEIAWLRFWKYDGLLPEHKPGLAAGFADDWKKTAASTCEAETTINAALSCVVRHKIGMQASYQLANKQFEQLNRQADPIFQFCRKTFGDYWEGVEQCVKDQNAAKARMGQ